MTDDGRKGGIVDQRTFLRDNVKFGAVKLLGEYCARERLSRADFLRELPDVHGAFPDEEATAVDRFMVVALWKQTRVFQVAPKGRSRRFQ